MKDVGKSIAVRLKNLARKNQINYQILLIRFLQERILYRISVSRFADSFCLKGGVLLYAIHEEPLRPTKDLDLLGLRGPHDGESLIGIFYEILSQRYPEDGVHFDPDSLVSSVIAEDDKYPGIRLKLNATLSSIRQVMQIDVGFSDTLVVGPDDLTFPTILELDAPVLKSYTIESVMAEKLEAIVDLGEANSRLKDYFDLYHLIQSQNWDKIALQKAIENTFTRRNTRFPAAVDSGFEELVHSEFLSKRWNAFLKKTNLRAPDFQEVHAIITNLLSKLDPK